MFFLLFSRSLSGRAPVGVDWPGAGALRLREACGGIALGLLLGWMAYFLIKRVDNYRVEGRLTLALVSGGYALAQSLHVSGPLAIVAAGILIGNQARNFAMSAQSRDNLDLFGEMIDEILNALFFVLIGLEVLILRCCSPGSSAWVCPGCFCGSFAITANATD